ncbi:hypothetical protein DL93DRAFT_2091476 [Clavulina sp. PMI_390]|nr:hypothetical protein DL93DRAFT_2091476 [Clavulina sp. PMI_390]
MRLHFDPGYGDVSADLGKSKNSLSQTWARLQSLPRRNWSAGASTGVQALCCRMGGVLLYAKSINPLNRTEAELARAATDELCICATHPKPRASALCAQGLPLRFSLVAKDRVNGAFWHFQPYTCSSGGPHLVRTRYGSNSLPQ